MGYRMRARIDNIQIIKTYNTLRKGAQEEYSSAEIIRQLESQGLKYRRQNMLRDIRRARACERAHTPEGRTNGMKWFDEVFEPYQKMKGLDPRDALDIWKGSVRDTEQELELIEAEAEMWELYEAAF